MRELVLTALQLLRVELRQHFQLVDVEYLFFKVSTMSSTARYLPGRRRKLCDEGQLDEALVMLDLIDQQGGHLSQAMLYEVLKGCIVKKDLVAGRRVHDVTLKFGFAVNTFLASHFIRMYSLHGMMLEARNVFNELTAPDTYVYAAMIAAYAENGQIKESVKIYQQMRQSAVKANNYVYVAILKACARAVNLQFGKQVHSDIALDGFESDVFVGNNLVHMYAKCGSLVDARAVFDRMSSRNVVTWTAMIGGYARQGFGQEALDLYSMMPKDGVSRPNKVTFICLLKACASIGAMHEGQLLHSQMQEQGLETDLVVGNTLIDMYAKCGQLKHAHEVFDRLKSKDVVTWNAMIAGYTQQGLGDEAIELYARMREGCFAVASNVTFIITLKACGSVGALQVGKQIHTEILQRGLEADDVISNALIDMYAKCGSLLDARKVFDRLSTKDMATWTAMIAGYAQQGLGEEAIKLYACKQQMDKSPVSNVTYACLLKACASTGAIHDGRRLHMEIQAHGLEGDLVVGNSLVNMYAKCRSLEDARRVFDRLPVRDVVTWNAMISGYTQHGLVGQALDLYVSMKSSGTSTPNKATYLSLLKACASTGALPEGKALHADINRIGLEADAAIGNTLVDMYAKCGNLNDALGVFDRMTTKNVVTWTVMISGYVQHGLASEALDKYVLMQKDGQTPADSVAFLALLKACGTIGAIQQGKQLHVQICERGLDADVVMGNALVDMYAKCRSLEDARKVFDKMPIRDVVTWTSLIAGYSDNGLGQEAADLFATMQKDGKILADSVAIVSTLKLCGNSGAVDLGKQIHAEIQKRGLETDVFVGSSLVDMYVKCGCLQDACAAFDRLPTKNVVTWNSLINGYGHHNDCRMAVKCFEEMRCHAVEPDAATFLSLLAACSRVGLVNEGQRYFEIMVDEHRIAPSVDHYNCIVDLLARSGDLDKAEHILLSMPFTDNTVGWRCLLAACKAHNDVGRGRRCFDRLMELEPQQAAGYVLMSGIYAKAGRWKDVEALESSRRSAAADKKPAKTWIEVNNKVQEFVVGEERDDVSSKLKSMNLLLKVGGHVPHSELVMKPLSQQEKEDALCGHAEKLALAYGLLNTTEGSTLVVTKNLRMCSDCHSGTKILSRIERREIVVRDAHRVHHFRDGFCSCGVDH